MRGLYRYGFFLAAHPDDPVVADFTEAEELARSKSELSNGSPVAVWDVHNNTLSLFAGFEHFKPAQ